MENRGWASPNRPVVAGRRVSHCLTAFADLELEQLNAEQGFLIWCTSFCGHSISLETRIEKPRSPMNFFIENRGFSAEISYTLRSRRVSLCRHSNSLLIGQVAPRGKSSFLWKFYDCNETAMFWYFAQKLAPSGCENWLNVQSVMNETP